MAQRVPGGAPGLTHVSDDELLAHTRRLVGKSNQLLAALLLHLSEIEARGAHRSRRCASLYTYCIYELRFSEDAAARRSAAARFVREFPLLLDAVAAGELHLTGLLMIGPHLTLENHVEVLARARFRTKKELGLLVRDLNPLPSAPDVIEPLGPALARRALEPTWEQFAAALAPEVRELPAGERPQDWAKADNDKDEHDHGDAVSEDALPVGPAPEDLPPITGPQLFQVQFGTVEEHVELVERAKALLARTRPEITLGELHLEAMKLFVAALEKRRFAVTEQPRQPRQRGEGGQGGEPRAPEPRQRGEGGQGGEPRAPEPRQRGEEGRGGEPRAPEPRQRGEGGLGGEPRAAGPRQRGETAERDARPTESPCLGGEAVEPLVHGARPTESPCLGGEAVE